MNAVDFDLYLVTDRNQTGGRDLLWVLEQALDGGVKAIQLREKDLSGRDLFSLAERSHKLCQAYDAALFINDRVDVAMAVDAAGVQLSQTSLPVSNSKSPTGTAKDHRCIDAFASRSQGSGTKRRGFRFVRSGLLHRFKSRLRCSSGVACSKNNSG